MRHMTFRLALPALAILSAAAMLGVAMGQPQISGIVIFVMFAGALTLTAAGLIYWRAGQ